MKSLLILGSGGYGKLVREIAELNGYEKIDFLDDNAPEAVGRICDLERLEGSYDGVIVAIGSVEIREKIKIKNPVTLIHPRANISKSTKIENGCVMEANVVVNTGAVVGKGSFICAGAVVNHNAVVGEFCQIDCNAVVACGAVVPNKKKVESCTVWNKK